MFPVKTWVPSFRMQVERPVARSAVRALKAVEDMTVPVTTGWPAVLIEKVPLEKDICYPSSVEWIATPLGVMLFWWLSRRNGLPSGEPSECGGELRATYRLGRGFGRLLGYLCGHRAIHRPRIDYRAYKRLRKSRCLGDSGEIVDGEISDRSPGI